MKKEITKQDIYWYCFWTGFITLTIAMAITGFSMEHYNLFKAGEGHWECQEWEEICETECYNEFKMHYICETISTYNASEIPEGEFCLANMNAPVVCEKVCKNGTCLKEVWTK